jgi:hypothetical protein
MEARRTIVARQGEGDGLGSTGCEADSLEASEYLGLDIEEEEER